MYFLIAYMVYASIAFCTIKNDMRPELFLCLSMGQVYFERKETSKLMFYTTDVSDNWVFYLNDSLKHLNGTVFNDLLRCFCIIFNLITIPTI